MILALEGCIWAEMEGMPLARQVGDRPWWHESQERTAKGLEDREVPTPGGSKEGFLEEEVVGLGWEDLALWPLELFP